MGFGGYLGLFIGASILSLYDIFISFFIRLVTKFKSRVDSEIKTEELNAEIEECNEGQWRTVFIKMQAELVKQGETIKKLEKLLAKQANILANLEKKK